MRTFTKLLLLFAILTIHLKMYAVVARRVDLFAKLKRLQQDIAYDERYNDIAPDPIDNVLFFLSDGSPESLESPEEYDIPTTSKPTTVTAATTTTTTPTTTTAQGPQSYEDMTLVDRRERAAHAWSSAMANFMRSFVNSFLGPA